MIWWSNLTCKSLFIRALPTRLFASPRGLYKEVFLKCSLHSVLSHMLHSNLLVFALLYSALFCYPRAPLLNFRPAPSASSPQVTLVYIWRYGSRAYVRSFTAAVSSLQVIEGFFCRNLVFKVATR